MTKFLEARIAAVDTAEEYWCRNPAALKLLLQILLVAVKHNGALRSPPGGGLQGPKRDRAPETQVALLLQQYGSVAGAAGLGGGGGGQQEEVLVGGGSGGVNGETATTQVWCV